MINDITGESFQMRIKSRSWEKFFVYSIRCAMLFTRPDKGLRLQFEQVKEDLRLESSLPIIFNPLSIHVHALALSEAHFTMSGPAGFTVELDATAERTPATSPFRRFAALSPLSLLAAPPVHWNPLR
jgi:hypothetical protein